MSAVDVPCVVADDPPEDPDYLSRQLVTYIGNKRALLGNIALALARVRLRLGGRKLRALDAFAGSGVVSRFLKAHCAYLASNDIEDYAAVLARCHLANRGVVELRELSALVAELNANVENAPLPRGFIEAFYAPADEANITKRDRVFYTKSNARRLDNYRRMLAALPERQRVMLLGPLLARASVHANTAGVFKGFYKNRRTQAGQFGGSGSDALGRILGSIVLDVPVLSRFECDVGVFQHDANALARELRDLDVAYLDPPYNQHPYGSNYFMLNLIANYRQPAEVSTVAGIPTDWKRSGYNVRSRSLPLLADLAETIDAKFLLVSFNDEGFIAPDAMRAMLGQLGTVDVIETQYNAFRGSRNFDNRPIHVTEQLFLVEKR
ncbi:MAG TPA: DNA adenine methylase [Rhodanobacteraceae bacterium]|nr:DNA adenine methylase [Rhodanobacteraceae bacterium]